MRKGTGERRAAHMVQHCCDCAMQLRRVHVVNTY